MKREETKSSLHVVTVELCDVINELLAILDGEPRIELREILDWYSDMLFTAKKKFVWNQESKISLMSTYQQLELLT